MLEIIEKQDYQFAEIGKLGTYSTYDRAIEDHIDAILKLDLVDVEAIKRAHFSVALDCVNSTGLGFTVRTSVVMELCPTIITLLLVGNLGSRITSEIGSMRVTEQIDALEVMGINSASYLILPKIISALFVIPMLIGSEKETKNVRALRLKGRWN